MNSRKTHAIRKDRSNDECFRRTARKVSRLALAIAFLSAQFVIAVTPARAQTLTVLHGFGSPTDGANSQASLIRDTQGTLYGTTVNGGAFGYGTVFMMSASGVEKVLYSFTGGADGANPYGSLVRDSQGNLFGTTLNGGAFGYGIVFMTTRAGIETVLHSFSGGADGAYPWAGLLRDAQGYLYGTTLMGGSPVLGYGTVFKVTPSGTESVLHAFGGPDGTFPSAALIQDASGIFYGTTGMGGAHGHGAVFSLTLAGALTVLYSFTGGGDGDMPISPLVRDAQGYLYGTASSGGIYGYGTVFSVSPSGIEKVLHSFTLMGTDGGNPFAGLVQDSNSVLFGTTYYGGIHNYGTIFMVISASSTYRPLYSFTAGADGAGLYGGLVVDARDNLYGITQWYGTNGGGAAFRLAP